jgi:hypothetical protein
VTNRQLVTLIVAVTVLSLTLAWIVERTQVRQFVAEFDTWWEAKNGGTGTGNAAN